MNKKEVILFNKLIPPNKKDVLHYRIPSDCTVEEVRVRFYQGVQGSLQVIPFIEHKGNKIENLIDYASGTDQWVTGENDYFVFPVVVPCEFNDFLKVEVKNTSVDFAYTCMVQVVLDFYGGQGRAELGGVIH